MALGLGLAGVGGCSVLTAAWVVHRWCRANDMVGVGRYHTVVTLAFVAGWSMVGLLPEPDGRLGDLLALLFFVSLVLTPTLPLLYASALPRVEPRQRRMAGALVLAGWWLYGMGWGLVLVSRLPADH